MRVSADNSKCVVSCMCVYRAPEVFDQDDDGLVLVRDPAPPAHLADEIRRAAEGCPVGAIQIEETP
ncbi:MAG TPA: ferredoxin [Amycolatopsis sp.]|nr:ferredoxin [Amycolatopsis sp.]